MAVPEGRYHLDRLSCLTMMTPAAGYWVARLVVGDGALARKLLFAMAEVFDEEHQPMSDLSSRLVTAS
jgi:hypothetical protein